MLDWVRMSCFCNGCMKLCFLVGGEQRGYVHVALTVYFVAFPQRWAAANLNQRRTNTHKAERERERDMYALRKWNREIGRDSHDGLTWPLTLPSSQCQFQVTFWFSFISFPYLFFAHFLFICLCVNRELVYREALQLSEPLKTSPSLSSPRASG